MTCHRRGHDRRFSGVLLTLLLAGPLFAPVHGAEVDAGSVEWLSAQALQTRLDTDAGGELPLNQRALVQWNLLRNPDVLVGREATEIAAQQLRADRGVWQPQVFVELERTSSQRRNSSERSDLPVLEDRETRGEVGVRMQVATGAELSLSYDVRDRFSTASSADDPEGIDDAVGRLRFEVRQPLLQGIGARAIRSGIAQTERQLDIAREELRQQALSSSFEILNLYWQLHRVERVAAISAESRAHARSVLDDTRRLVAAGRLPETAEEEAEALVLLRDAEAMSIEQERREVMAGLRTRLNLAVDGGDDWSFRAVERPRLSAPDLPTAFEPYFSDVLAQWPNHHIALQRLKMAEEALRIAHNERLPTLDLVMHYGQQSRDFDSSLTETFREARRDDFPEWGVAVEFSMPLGPNQTARARQDMARSQIVQSSIDAESVRVQLGNQLRQRIDQVRSAHAEALQHQQHVAVMQRLLESEQRAFERGSATVQSLIDREDRLNQSLLRLIDAEVRFELAKLALSLSDGSLLAMSGTVLIGAAP